MLMYVFMHSAHVNSYATYVELHIGMYMSPYTCTKIAASNCTQT